MHRKNSVMMIMSLILLIYAFFISIYPSALTSTFNKDKFEKKVYKASGLVTTVDDVDFKITPGLTLIITLRNWSSKYIDEQDCFDAGMIEIRTNALAPVTKNFKIKEMYLKHVRFSDQILPDGQNKLAYIPSSFEASAFGAKKITIKPGPVKVRDFRIKKIAPGFYEENNRRETAYRESDVRYFLQQQKIRHIKVK